MKSLLLQRAIAIAREAHAGQVDLAGKPYIAHPLRVMGAVEGEEAKIVAVLHDVVEDSPDWPLAKLAAEGFSADVLAAVDALSRKEGEAYEAFIARIAGNPLAKLVKLADLADNLSRPASLKPHLKARYLQAVEALS
jgi:(p)ppGpp synthase/HD superfamily hydrolase